MMLLILLRCLEYMLQLLYSALVLSVLSSNTNGLLLADTVLIINIFFCALYLLKFASVAVGTTRLSLRLDLFLLHEEVGIHLQDGLVEVA